MCSQAVKGSEGTSGSKRADDGRGFVLPGFRAAMLSTHRSSSETDSRAGRCVELCDVKADDLCSRCTGSGNNRLAHGADEGDIDTTPERVTSPDCKR